jgi:peptide/nickel transport system permease protein
MDYKILLRSRFTRFIASRLAQAILSALFVAVIVFFAMRSIPGDPVVIILGTDATPEQYERMTALMGLDKPIVAQFLVWLGQVATGDWGHSFTQGKAVADVVGPALENTLALGAAATLIAVIVGLALGNLATSSVRPLRRVADWAEAIFLSAPQYTVALILLVGLAVVVPVFPAGGLVSLRDPGPFDLLLHLVLPATALSLAPGAQMARSLKTSILELQSKELIPSLRARGLSPIRLSAHVHHNALPPMITVLGIQVGTMLGGALFVENIFSIPGLGNLVVQSLGLRDYAVVQAVSFLIAIIFIVVMLLADVVNAVLDPRIRVGVV